MALVMRTNYGYSAALPRQGRAMSSSFYFPRMGRSDQEVDNKKPCCADGVRSIFTTGKGVFEVCPRDQECCHGLRERTKVYKELVVNECAAAYFAFPRQGRAMSFYFPRMGRSDPDAANDQACCGEGVSSIFTAGKGVFEVCPHTQGCCTGLVERTKIYKDVVINECSQSQLLVVYALVYRIMLDWRPYFMVYEHVVLTTTTSTDTSRIHMIQRFQPRQNTRVDRRRVVTSPPVNGVER